MAADPAVVRTPDVDPTGEFPASAPSSVDRPVPAIARRCQWLVQREGSFWERGRYFEFPPSLNEATLGRSLSCHLRVNAESVSRIHAALVRKPRRGVYLMDLASREGTFLNGERVEADELLMDGDRIGLGDGIVLEFVDGPRPREAAAKRLARRFGWSFSVVSMLILGGILLFQAG